MKEIPLDIKPTQRPRLSLEQKILRMVSRYRAVQKRRKKKSQFARNPFT
jgi:hypothetical protein